MMNRLVMHHTGGSYTPNATDLNAYHGVYNGDGERIKGVHPIDDNDPRHGQLQSGRYAAHCRNLNSGAIGESIACMGGGVWAQPFAGRYVPTLTQFDAFFKGCALLTLEYRIDVTRTHCLTHAEVQPTLNVKQKNKWDYDYDAINRTATRDPLAIGDEFRQEILIQQKNVMPTATTEPPTPNLTPVTIQQGEVGGMVGKVQNIVGAKSDGVFGPTTRDKVIVWQRRHNLLADGVVGPMTWRAMGY